MYFCHIKKKQNYNLLKNKTLRSKFTGFKICGTFMAQSKKNIKNAVYKRAAGLRFESLFICVNKL